MSGAARAPGLAAAADAAPAHDARHRAAGVAWAAAAYLSWGLFPLYFHALGGVPAGEILAYRIACSAAFMALLLTATRRWGEALRQLRARRTLASLAASAVFISLNWLVYVWAVNAGRVLEASLGYFVNPLVSVLLGVAFLREPLTRAQKAAVAIAAAGVVALVVRAGTFPWVALVLAGTFGLYGLIRKRVPVDATVGLFGEVALLSPLAVAWLASLAARGQSHLGDGVLVTALLLATGVVTALPLIWFALGVRRLRLSTIGLLQYLNPTMQFLIAVVVFREPFSTAHAVAFGCIWVSLAIYSYEALVRGK